MPSFLKLLHFDEGTCSRAHSNSHWHTAPCKKSCLMHTLLLWHATACHHRSWLLQHLPGPAAVAQVPASSSCRIAWIRRVRDTPCGACCCTAYHLYCSYKVLEGSGGVVAAVAAMLLQNSAGSVCHLVFLHCMACMSVLAACAIDPLLSSQSTHLFLLLIMALYCPLILALIQAKQPGNCAIYACPCCRGTTAQPVWIIHDGLSLLGQHITLLGQHHTIAVQRWMFEVFWSIASLAVQLQVDAVCSLCRARVVKIRAIGLTVELPSGSAMALPNCNLGKIISRLPT